MPNSCDGVSCNNHICCFKAFERKRGKEKPAILQNKAQAEEEQDSKGQLITRILKGSATLKLWLVASFVAAPCYNFHLNPLIFLPSVMLSESTWE